MHTSTDAIDSNLILGESTLISPARLFLDHLRRTIDALAGFRVCGGHWFRPWATYCALPIVKHLAPETSLQFDGFRVRLQECDLYTFANVFADYPLGEIVNALPEVNLIVDLGANVGAFSFLLRNLCDLPIVAVEPDPKNVAFLRAQPFASSVEIHEAAVGSFEGSGRLATGINSVTHHVDFAEHAEGHTVSVLGLSSLCRAPALVKMDIEGAELGILEHGLPDNVLHLVLEWHHNGSPADLVPGNWKQISTDMYGASTWYFRR